MNSNPKTKVELSFVRVLIASLFILLLCTSCKEKGVDIIVSDYDTQKVITTINSVEDEDRFLKLTDAIYYSQTHHDDILYIVSEKEVYSVFSEDQKNSKHDIWYKVAFEYDNAFIGYDFSKMDEEYVEELKETGVTDDYIECTYMSRDEFKKLLLGE